VSEWAQHYSTQSQDNPSKLKFFKGLASVLPRFPPRLIKEKVVPALLAELVRTRLSAAYAPVFGSLTAHHS
jgi:hypothetical protein